MQENRSGCFFMNTAHDSSDDLLRLGSALTATDVVVCSEIAAPAISVETASM